MTDSLENVTKIAQLLGEKNERRLKDKITDILVECIRDELFDRNQFRLG